MTVLAGDIGGTKTLLQISQPDSDGIKILYEQRFASADYSEFDLMLQDFVNQSANHCETPGAACFGVAGPVEGRTARTTNLPWKLDADLLENDFNIPHVRLINDFQSVGYGVEALKPEDIVTLQTGKEAAHGTRVLIGAGTGLGHGILSWEHDHYEVIASEAGHSSFAASDEQQIELSRYLKKRYGHATWERAVSGHGLVNIFEFMLENGATESDALKQARQNEDPAAAISRFALTGTDALASDALDLFVKLYGSQAGNIALTGLATGGVYIAGGIAPKIIEKLKGGTFMSAFIDKEERMQGLLKSMPVHVVMNAKVGLLGSSLAASRLVS